MFTDIDRHLGARPQGGGAGHRRALRRPSGGRCRGGALGLSLLAAGLCPGWSVAGAPAGNTVTMEGMTCRYADRASWLAPDDSPPQGAPRLAAMAFTCHRVSGDGPPDAEPPALALRDADGATYPGELRREPPGGDTLMATAVFALPTPLPAGPWGLQVTRPGRNIQLPLSLPSD